MLFNSLHYVVFLPVIVILYFALAAISGNSRLTRWMLLLASLYFYMSWNAYYLGLILFSIVVTWFAGIGMDRYPGRKNLILAGSMIANLSVLVVFKYYNFIARSVSLVAGAFSIPVSMPLSSLLLPVGISFYTFQALGYTMDVYRSQVKAERNLATYALFVTFFPQLVAGPIERTENLLPQFSRNHAFDYKNATEGLRLIAWGMFKKVVIADRVSVLVDTVYRNPENYDGFAFVVATVFFAFQIFCDFSGYSDIAVGSARMMGFRLMENFRRPYYSKSISEFWKRWHISLSSWFKDYLYLPLGGSRVPKTRWLLNLMITFTVSGLWHGANWTYVVWGMLNGLYLVASILTAGARERLVSLTRLDRFPALRALLQVGCTFCLTCFAWIFFRAGSIKEALYMIGHLHTGFSVLLNPTDLKHALLGLGMDKEELIIAVLSICLMEAVHFAQRRLSVGAWISARPALLRWTLYYGFTLMVVLFGVYGTNDFIYFQF